MDFKLFLVLALSFAWVQSLTVQPSIQNGNFDEKTPLEEGWYFQPFLAYVVKVVFFHRWGCNLGLFDWWRIFYLYVDSCHWRSICKLLTFQATIIFFIKSSNLGFKWTTNDFCLYNWWWATQQSMWEQWWFRRTRFWSFEVHFQNLST